MEEAAQLSKVFQADFTTVTEGTESFHEIAITGGDKDLQEFEARKQSIGRHPQSVEKRFSYLEDDPVLKAAAVLDPDVWPKDSVELASYGDAEIQLLADYYQDYLSSAGCECDQIVREWSAAKRNVSLHLSSRPTEEVSVSVFRSHAR